MFTGIVKERGRVAEAAASAAGGARFSLAHSAELGRSLEIGASLAVGGVCLTVVALDFGEEGATSRVDLAPETLARTTLGHLQRGDEVNLEPPLRVGEPLGGHLVQGHVDGTTTVLARKDDEEHRRLTLGVPDDLTPFFVMKGSVAVDGVSLTVAGLADSAPPRFEVSLIPHTLAVTTLGRLREGDRVNLEVDVLGKYVARMLSTRGLISLAGAADADLR
jgi:riboflavin synthase